MAANSVSTPGAMCRMALGHVAGELVVTTSFVSRSHQALCRIRWCPGSVPVTRDVWLASVTVGIPAMAPKRKAVPMAMSRAMLGARPSAASR
jgi:hypothetical protein